MRKLVYGVGVNDADYVTQLYEEYGYVNGKRKRKKLWTCPFYQTWANMLERGYRKGYKIKYPTYEDVTVCEKWHRFSVFKSWMEQKDWVDKQLDKDLLVQGNKVYCPEACVFVSGQVNMFLTTSSGSRGEYKIGVSWHRDVGKFMANCRDPFTRKGEYLGLFLTEEEAHEAWLTKKLEHACALAALQTDERVAKALIDYYENYNSERRI